MFLDGPKPGFLPRFVDVEPSRDFAVVVLNRDDFVDRARVHGIDPTVPEAMKKVVDRCAQAARDRLLVDGVVTTRNPVPDDRFLELGIPYRYIDDAVEALRDAELKGNLEGLSRLTDRLTVPFDEWLAPGNRELRRGIDFHCTPNHLLRVLRNKAKDRGIRVNGRAELDRVTVDPTPPAQFRSFVSTPDEIATTAAPERSNHAREARSVEFVSHNGAPNIPDRNTCECGATINTTLETRHHDRQHMDWHMGVRVPRTVNWSHEPIAVVSPRSPHHWQQVAHQCALVAKRAGRYDFPPFPRPTKHAIPQEPTPFAFLYHIDGRVVGYLAATHRGGHWLHHEENETVASTDPTIRPSVDLVFVANRWRRAGIARALVTALAAHSKTSPTELAWALPFTAQGRALADSLGHRQLWVSK